MIKRIIKKSWRRILWAIAIPAVAIVVAVFIGVAIGGFEWSVAGEVFSNLWILFVIVFAVVLGLMLLMARYREKVIVIGLLVIGVLFVFASAQDDPIAAGIRAFIISACDVRFLVGGVSFIALAVAFATAHEKGKGGD